MFVIQTDEAELVFKTRKILIQRILVFEVPVFVPNN